MTIEPSNPLAQAIATAIVVGLTSIAGTVGGLINAWVARRRQRSKDFTAATLKIVDLYKRLGVEKCPSELQTMDDIFSAIRDLYTRTEKKP